MYFKDAFGPESAPVALSVRGGTAGQIVFPTSELPDEHEDAAIALRDVPAVFGTGVCATGGSDVVMAVLSPDSCDSICTMDHPSELLPLDGAPVTHLEDISVLLDMTDTVLTRRTPGLLSLVVAVGRSGGTLPTSAWIHPIFWIWVIRCSACRCRSFDVASTLWILPVTLTRGLIFWWGSSVGPWVGRRVRLAEACCSGLLCRGVSPQSPMFRDFLQGPAHMSPALPVREDWWYISAGVGSATPLQSYLVTGSHLFVPPVCRGIVLQESRMLPGLLPWTVVVCSRTFRALCWLCIMPSGSGLPDTERAGVDSRRLRTLCPVFSGGLI